MRLFHFSDDPSIRSFIPRAPAVLPQRQQGLEWLNDPLVWAIDAWHQPMYLFPRDCPRILVWPTKDTAAHDRAAWTGGSARMIAYIERDWLAALESAHVLRYEFPPQPFEMLDDAGMWISRTTVQHLSVTRIGDLPGTLREKGVDLRAENSLAPLRGLWNTTLHASGIRLRNARTWTAPHA